MSFVTNVAKLGSGTLVAQAISLGVMPIITRLYSPEEFGVFALYLSVTMILFPISHLRYNSAILIPEKSDEAANLAIIGILATVLFSLVVAPVCVLLTQIYSGYTGITKQLLWLIVVGTLIQGITQSVQFYSLRQKRFGIMAKASIAEAISDRGLVLGLGFNGGGAPSLILGRLIGPFVHLIYLCRNGFLQKIRIEAQGTSLPDLWKCAVKYKNFPLYSSWAFLFGNGARELPIILLTAMYSPLIAGAYALGMRVMSWPILMIGDAVGKAFFQKMAEKKNDIKLLKHNALLMLKYLTYMMLPPILILVFFGKELFAYVFGENWSDAGFYVEILAVSFYLTFISRVLSIFFDIFERQSKRLVLNISLFLTRALCILIGGYYADVVGAITGLFIGTSVVNIISISYLFKLVGVSIKEFIATMCSSIGILTPLIITLMTIDYQIHSGLLSIMIIAVFGIVFQIIFLLIVDSDFKIRLTLLKSNLIGGR